MWARLFAIVVICITPALAAGQALSDRVPADVLIYVGWRGSDGLGPGFQASNLKAVLDESNIPQLLDEFIPKAVEKLGQVGAEGNADQAQQVKEALAVAG